MRFAAPLLILALMSGSPSAAQSAGGVFGGAGLGGWVGNVAGETTAFMACRGPERRCSGITWGMGIGGATGGFVLGLSEDRRIGGAAIGWLVGGTVGLATGLALRDGWLALGGLFYGSAVGAVVGALVRGSGEGIYFPLLVRIPIALR